MNSIIKGKVWKFGDNIDTDIIIPGRYLTLRDPDEMASHAFEPIDPEFSKKVKKGDVILGGKNFGSGSSREEAPFVLKQLGISAIVAESFARIFFRNAINLGIPLIEIKEISKKVNARQEIEIDLSNGTLKNLESQETFKYAPIPNFLMDILAAGGAIEAIKKRIKK
ncbi:MAG: 3-isopropylmalate dehydratase small subunit [Candidatus Helarchaeota archaeon]|nr:3-isopropylmalate dehydratase small subunit [Candidatus Helarchaeota archaeon]